MGPNFGHRLFSWIGVGDVQTHVEMNCYVLLRLINDTRKVAEGLNKELGALREMVLQKQEVLDLLTAAQGGESKLIGCTCCTYIQTTREIQEVSQRNMWIRPPLLQCPLWIPGHG